MHAIPMPAPDALNLSVRALGLEPLDTDELRRVNGGAYWAAAVFVAAGIGGVFVAAAVIAASYYVYKHAW